MTITLQGCAQCGARQYPPRDLCRACLADALGPVEETSEGRLIVSAIVHRSLEPDFAGDLPLRIGTVHLDCGLRIVVFVDAGLADGQSVRLRQEAGADGVALWHAGAPEAGV